MNKKQHLVLTCVPLFVCLVWSEVGDKQADHEPVGMLHSEQIYQLCPMIRFVICMLFIKYFPSL